MSNSVKIKSKSIRYKRYIFALISFIFILSVILFCFPISNTTLVRYNPGLNTYIKSYSFIDEGIKINLKNPIFPQISDYFVINIKATNNKSVEFPTGTASVRWKFLAGDEFSTLNQQKFKIFIDGVNHNYYVPVGECKYWLYENQIYENKTKKPEAVRSDYKISSIRIDIPKVEGVTISVNKIILKRRILFPLDSYINYYFKNNYNIHYINRFLTPTYILLTAILFIFFIYNLYNLSKETLINKNSYKLKYLKIKPIYKIYRKDSDKKSLFGNSYKLNSHKLLPKKFSKDDTNRKYSHKIYNNKIKKPFAFILISILILFSFYFISLEAFTVKGYWDSYKNYILSGNLDKTYPGFYDFEKFILWVDKKIPGNSNIIVLVRGEPVYIMSEMVYNLYPRDIKFINISGKTREKIIYEITRINFKSEGKYSYIIAFSEKDSLHSNNLDLIYKYTDTGGFIYRYNK